MNIPMILYVLHWAFTANFDFIWTVHPGLARRMRYYYANKKPLLKPLLEVTPMSFSASHDAQW